MSDKPQRILRIWHKLKHNDYTVTERTTAAPISDVETIRIAGGFWTEAHQFVPWHSISCIEESEQP
jgi:hypothetical protein